MLSALCVCVEVVSSAVPVASDKAASSGATTKTGFRGGGDHSKSSVANMKYLNLYLHATFISFSSAKIFDDSHSCWNPPRMRTPRGGGQG